MEYIKGENRKERIFFPSSINDYISEDNPVQFIDIFVESLDLKELGFNHSELKKTGRPPYNPGDLLKLYIYGYLNRIRSSRRLEKESKRNIELMWLLSKLTPDFKTIANFRKDNKESLKRVCKEFIMLCKKLELFGGETIAIDGSKFKAVNSKKRNFSKEKLKKRIKEIEKRVEEYLKELDANDQEESEVKDLSAEELKIILEELKKRKDKYEELLQELEDSGENQVSLTDKDARAMLNNQKVEVCYNIQAAVDKKHKLIVEHEVTNEANDLNQLSDMSLKAKEVLGTEEIEVLADKGYHKGEELKKCEENGIKTYVPRPKSKESKKNKEFSREKFKYDKEQDVYICPEGKELSYVGTRRVKEKQMKVYKCFSCEDCKNKSKCINKSKNRIISRWEHEELLEKLDERVKANKSKVKERQGIIEHVFGTLKRNFNQGYFLMRGLTSVKAEISLSVLVYNITRVLNILGVEKLINVLKEEAIMVN